MDAYIQIAHDVLRAAKRPMGCRAILDLAYLKRIVPPHLYGKAQHKTLQARLSEDILVNRRHSAFFRTAPGRFFLSEFLFDPTIPEEFRTPMIARRRTREWQRGPALAFYKSDVLPMADKRIAPKTIRSLIKAGRYTYEDPKAPRDDTLLIWSFVSLVRKTNVLSYRVGRYREDRDTFHNRRSIGFYTLVTNSDVTLFNRADVGIASSGIEATRLDLDFAEEYDEPSPPPHAHFFAVCNHSDDEASLLSFTRLQCPSWFEPTKRRLAINNLEWLDLSVPINDFADFEPWSRCIMSCLDSRHS